MRNSFWLCIVLVMLLASCKRDEESYGSSLGNGLLAFYPFNGNANDESGNNYHLTVNNVVFTKDYFLKEDQAISLNGVNTSLKIPRLMKANDLTNFTISLWAKSTLELNKSFSLINVSGKGGASMGLRRVNAGSLSDNSLQLPMHSGFGIIPLSQSIDTPVDEWMHLVFGQSADELFLYVNGVKTKSNQREPASISFTDGGHIGCSYFKSSVPELDYIGNFYKGTMDNIRIYKRALRQQEIAHLFSTKN